MPKLNLRERAPKPPHIDQGPLRGVRRNGPSPTYRRGPRSDVHRASLEPRRPL